MVIVIGALSGFMILDFLMSYGRNFTSLFFKADS